MEFTPFETAIKNYLDKRAEEDAQFATTYAKPNKNIKECCKYIFQQVEKNKPKGERCVGVSDDEVFGLAVHYYDEDDIVVDGPKNKVEAVQSPHLSRLHLLKSLNQKKSLSSVSPENQKLLLTPISRSLWIFRFSNPISSFTI